MRIKNDIRLHYMEGEKNIIKPGNLERKWWWETNNSLLGSCSH